MHNPFAMHQGARLQSWTLDKYRYKLMTGLGMIVVGAFMVWMGTSGLRGADQVWYHPGEFGLFSAGILIFGIVTIFFGFTNILGGFAIFRRLASRFYIVCFLGILLSFSGGIPYAILEGQISGSIAMILKYLVFGGIFLFLCGIILGFIPANNDEK